MEQLNRSGVLNGPRDIRVEGRPLPTADAGGIVVKVSACGICGSDMHMWKHAMVPIGSVLGHEFSGSISAVGENVTGLTIGDRVTVNPMHGYVGVGGLPGGFADYVHIPNAVVGKTIYPLPDGMSDEEGALVEPLAVALHAIHRADPKPTDTVAVLGAGPIGLCVLAALKARGIGTVAISDVTDLRLSVAQTLGADSCFNASQGGLIDHLRERFGDSPIPYNPPAAAVDVVFECAGVAQTMQEAIKAVRFGGKVVYVASGAPFTVDPNDLLMRETTILGSWSYVDEFAEAIDLLQSRRVDLSPLVTQRYPLNDLTAAFEAQADAATAIKIMVEVA